jgi:hypothetical protein
MGIVFGGVDPARAYCRGVRPPSVSWCGRRRVSGSRARRCAARALSSPGEKSTWLIVGHILSALVSRGGPEAVWFGQSCATSPRRRATSADGAPRSAHPRSTAGITQTLEDLAHRQRPYPRRRQLDRQKRHHPRRGSRWRSSGHPCRISQPTRSYLADRRNPAQKRRPEARRSATRWPDRSGDMAHAGSPAVTR